MDTQERFLGGAIKVEVVVVVVVVAGKRDE